MSTSNTVINLPLDGITALTGDVTGSGTGSIVTTLGITTTKGDLIVHGASANNRLAIGTNAQVLTADSTQSLGVKWAAAAGTPAGSNKAVQFNNSGVFGADSPTFFGYDLASHSLAVIGLGINLGRPPNFVLEVAGTSLFQSPHLIRFPFASASSPLELLFGLDGTTEIPAIKIYSQFGGPTGLKFWHEGFGTLNNPYTQIHSKKDTAGNGVSGRLTLKTSLNDVVTDAQEILPDGRVGFHETSPQGTVHAVGLDLQVSDPVSLTATLTLASPLADVTSAIPSQGAGRLDAPTSPSATPNYGAMSGFTADGSTYLYTFRSFDGNAWSAPFSTATFTDDGSMATFDVSLLWSPPIQGSATLYAIGRQINAGPFVYQWVSAATSFLDDNSAFTDSAPSTFYNDFVANGSTWSFSQVVGVFASPSGAACYSPNPVVTASFSDSNDNSAFQMELLSSGPTTVKWIPNFAVGSYSGDTSSFPAFVGNDAFTGDTTIIPTSYGILSDGSALSRAFTLVQKDTVNGISVYSASPQAASTTDPNDGLSYYFNLQFFTNDLSPLFKIVDATNSLGFVTLLNPLGYDALSLWTDGTTITPTSVNTGAGIFKNNSTSITDLAPLTIQGGTDYSRLDFRTADGTRAFSIEGQSGATSFRSQNGTLTIQISNTGVGFFAQTPAGQQTGGAATAGAIYTANEQGMLQKVYDALRTFGLLS